MAAVAAKGWQLYIVSSRGKPQHDKSNQKIREKRCRPTPVETAAAEKTGLDSPGERKVPTCQKHVKNITEEREANPIWLKKERLLPALLLSLHHFISKSEDTPDVIVVVVLIVPVHIAVIGVHVPRVVVRVLGRRPNTQYQLPVSFA